MTTAEVACHQAYNAGDIDYYRAANCSQISINDKIIADEKKSENVKTALLLGVAVIGIGLLIYISVK